MVAGDGHGRSTAAPPTFELERFAWGAPDLLRVSGRFTGLGQAQTAAPELVLRGPERMHRLSAVPDTLSPPPEDGSLWSADFAWREPPVAFDAALLQLGPEIVVELPEPGTKRRRLRAQTLEVQTPGDPEPADRIRVEADLLAAQEEIRELRAAADRAQQEVVRAREDLEAERDRHAGDAERFREGLAAVRESAAEALAAEQSELRELREALAGRDAELREALEGREAELQEAIEARDAELREAIEARDSAVAELHEAIETRDAAMAELSGALEEAVAARTQAESQAEAAADALHQHRSALEAARGAADEARADAARMLTRLETVREAFGEPEVPPRGSP